MVFAVSAAILVAVVFGFGLVLARFSTDPQATASEAAYSEAVPDSAAADVVPAQAAPAGAASSVLVVDDLALVPPGAVERLEIAYFHRTHRCYSCRLAEDLTRRVVEGGYADRLGSGEMVMLVEDVEQPVDPDLVRKYDAYGSSLYFGVVKGGVTYIYPVNDIWFALADEAKFAELLRAKIDSIYAGHV